MLNYMLSFWHTLTNTLNVQNLYLDPNKYTLYWIEYALRLHVFSLLILFSHGYNIWHMEVSNSFSAIFVLTIQTQKISVLGSHPCRQFSFLFCVFLKDHQSFHLFNEKYIVVLSVFHDEVNIYLSSLKLCPHSLQSPPWEELSLYQNILFLLQFCHYWLIKTVIIIVYHFLAQGDGSSNGHINQAGSVRKLLRSL